MKNKSTRQLFSIAMILFVVFSLAQVQSVQAASSYQLPWANGQSWVIVGGFDNGSRPAGSAHRWTNGGALDLAPHNDMKIGEDTGNAAVYPIAPGTVVSSSGCYLKIDHGSNVTSEYYHLDRVSLKNGNPVNYTTQLGIIANNKAQATCSGGEWEGPHLHMIVRPQMEGLELSGWVLRYDNVKDRTSMTKGSDTKYIFQPILNSGGIPTPPPFVPTPPPTKFLGGPSSRLSDNNGSADLTVCADNIVGQTVNVLFKRPGRAWPIYSQKASSRCVTFRNMDGAGPLNGNTTYESRAALNQNPNPNWSPTSCYAGNSGQQGLCDTVRKGQR